MGLPQWDINRIIQSIDVDDSGNVSYTGDYQVGRCMSALLCFCAVDDFEIGGIRRIMV